MEQIFVDAPIDWHIADREIMDRIETIPIPFPKP